MGHSAVGERTGPFSATLPARIPLDAHDAGGTAGIKVAAVVRGRSVKVSGRWAGFALTDPLVGVGVRLAGGTLATCSRFPGSTVVSDAPGVFSARGPPPVLMRRDRVTLAQGIPDGGGGALNPPCLPTTRRIRAAASALAT